MTMKSFKLVFIYSLIFYFFTVLISCGLLTFDLIFTDTFDYEYNYDETYIYHVITSVIFALLPTIFMLFMNSLLLRKQHMKTDIMINFILAVPTSIIVLISAVIYVPPIFD